MKILTKILGLATLAVILIAGCSSNNNSSGPAPKTSATNSKPAAQADETVLGRTGVQKSYIEAHGWAPDALPFSAESQPTKNVPGEGGTSAVWVTSFGSPTRSTAKTFTWSGTDAADAPPRGTIPGAEDNFSASNNSTHTFELGFLKTDSDKAFAAAQAHGGKKLTDKNPKLPITYRLSWEPHDNALVWHVKYDDQTTFDVNATNGEFIRKEE